MMGSGIVIASFSFLLLARSSFVLLFDACLVLSLLSFLFRVSFSEDAFAADEFVVFSASVPFGFVGCLLYRQEARPRKSRWGLEEQGAYKEFLKFISLPLLYK